MQFNKSQSLKRANTHYVDDNIFKKTQGYVSSDVAADLQSYSDLLDLTINKINDSFSQIKTIEDLSKLNRVLDVANKNIVYIHYDFSRYVIKFMIINQINIDEFPLSEMLGVITSVSKIIKNYTLNTSKSIVTIKKEIAPYLKQITYLFSKLSGDYDMYAGMVNALVGNKEDDYDPELLISLNEIIKKYYKDATPYREKDYRRVGNPGANVTGFTFEKGNPETLISIIDKFIEDISKFEDDDNLPAVIISDIQLCTTTYNRLKAQKLMSNKWYASLDSFDIATEKIKTDVTTGATGTSLM